MQKTRSPRLSAWAASILFAVSCREVVPPNAPPSAPLSRPADEPAPVSEARAGSPAPAAPGKPFRLAWTLQTRPFLRGLALRGRHLAALGSRSLSLVELRSGNVIATRDVCPTFDGAFTFESDDRALLVCEQSVQSFTIPALVPAKTHKLPGRAIVAAFSTEHAAIAFDAGPVRIYALADWSLKGEVPVDDGVTSLALSPNGSQLAIGFDRGEVALVDRSANTAHRLTVKLGFPVEALSFDAAGKRLFSAAGPSAAVWSVATRSVDSTLETVSNVLAARWVGADEIGSGGRDGLLVSHLERGTATSVSGGLDGNEPAVALAVSRDDKVFCAAERDGKVACYARGTLPTRAIPTADYGADDVRTSGSVAAYVNQRLTVKAHAHTNLPEPGSDVRVLRYTEATVGTVRSTRWIEVSTARVIKIQDRVVHLLVTGAESEIPGVTNPLVYDTPVRLVWRREAPRPEKASPASPDAAPDPEAPSSEPP